MNMQSSEMNIFHEIPENNGRFKNPVVTIGNFDGVHLGHSKIINTLLEKSESHSGEAFVLTFRNHPRTVIHPGAICRMITTVDEKQKALNGLGVHNIIMLEFTKEFSNLTADQFYNELLIGRLGVKEIVIGYDHAFGKNREGNINYLLKLSERTGVKITRVSEEAAGGEIISSTLLRDEIDRGNVVEVEKLLGRKYTLSGTVVTGEGRGKDLGFPTANIRPEMNDKIIPGHGVYAVTVSIGSRGTFSGMLNIGNNPTFGGQYRSIEINIFDFDDDIYGEFVTLEFYRKIRDEKKFNSPEDLVAQLRYDKDSVVKILNEKV